MKHTHVAALRGAVFFTALTPAYALAAEGTVTRARVSVEHAACPGVLYDAPSYLSLLRVELKNDGVADVIEAPMATENEGIARLRLERPRCAADETVVVLHLVDPLTDKTLARGVDLSTTPAAARSRLLALASAELVRASWAEIAAERRRAVIESVTKLGAGNVRVVVKPETPPPPPPPTVVLAARPPEAEHGWFLGPTVELRQHLRHPGGMWSAGARLAWRSAHVQLAADLRGAYGTEGDPRGDLDISAITAGLSAQCRAESGALRVGFGPRIEGGAAWAGGSNAATGVKADRGEAAIVQVGLEAEASLRISNISPRVTMRAGDTLSGIGVAVDGKRTIGIDGPFISLAFGADWSL